MTALYPTRTRLALLRAIDAGNGRIYFAGGHVWDKALGGRVTARVAELVTAGWVRALAPNDPRGPGELRIRTYYRLTSDGETVLRGQR